MAAMVVNKFKMKDSVLTYNMSGMGCSSSLVCVDMASHLLKALPNTLALVVNHENITQNWYPGQDKSMLVCNCLFRLGGAAALLSNRSHEFSSVSRDLKLIVADVKPPKSDLTLWLQTACIPAAFYLRMQTIKLPRVKPT